ncbi:MAG: tetratricopeptide repeat protein [Fibrobacterota bacterium]|nr:tetratricopeptide repeat protein [Fibrobacterota bacterium]
MHFYQPIAFLARFRLPSQGSFLIALACLAVPASVSDDQDEWDNDSSQPSFERPYRPSGIPPAANSATRKLITLKEKANALYRAKRYEKAGELYREVADLNPADAAVRNDLGLCFLKRGMKDSALEAGREALRLADRSLGGEDSSVWSFPDLRARKSAYFTLDKLGGPMPEPRRGKCETWSAFSTCKARLYVCAEAGRSPAPGGELHWDILRIGLTRAKALFSYDELEVPSQVPHPEIRDMEEVSIDGMPESRMKWLNRDSSVTIPLGDALESADPACVGNCGKLEKVRSECRVIHFNPCSGVVGVACEIGDGGAGDRIVVGEYYLIPAK